MGELAVAATAWDGGRFCCAGVGVALLILCALFIGICTSIILPFWGGANETPAIPHIK